MVTVLIRDAQGAELLRFQANGEDTILEQAEAHNLDIPFACRAGACLSCVATIKSGGEHVIETLKGDKLIETEDNQCLTCIAGVKPSSVRAEEEYLIDIEVVM
jgi:ferredoxin